MERKDGQRVASFSLSPDPCKVGPFAGFSGLDRINSAAKRSSTGRLGGIRHHLNEENLRVAFRRLDGSKALGVEDRMVQTLLAKIYEAVFEPIFHRHSFGFRPGRSAHQAIAQVYKSVSGKKNGVWIVEMDIEKFFNSMEHEKLMRMIETKIMDGAFLDLTRNMLRATVLGVDGEIKSTELGAPQGSPLSPILANLFLHLALDEWFAENWENQGTIVRYADDAVFIFGDEQRVAQCIQKFKEWIKFERNRKKLDTLWQLTAAKLRGHYRYYGVSYNQNKLKSRMRKSRTSGSVRSRGWQQPLFT